MPRPRVTVVAGNTGGPFERVFGAFCDIGAFEYGPIADRLFANGFE